MTQRYLFETDEFTLLDFQRDAVDYMVNLAATHTRPRMCLYYRTGAGKTLTALACIRATGAESVTVVAPPTTHVLWSDTGKALGFSEVHTMSHAKFRQSNVKFRKDENLVIDEMHMLGGYKAVGWRKLEKLSLRLEAPLVVASATPNYNDVERCYCIQRITDPRATAGGYLTFLYRHCATEVNPWGRVPKVVEFLKYPDAASFLADLKHVMYIEDDLAFTIEDEPMELEIPAELDEYGVDRRKERVIASAIERKHRLVDYMMVAGNGELTPGVDTWLVDKIDQVKTPVLVFAVHTRVVDAVSRSLERFGIKHAVVTGATPARTKEWVLDTFRAGELEVLVGTQTLATGTDGLDKMCDMLVILDDTEDPAMRRQLIGRIMPRGLEDRTHSNRVVRLIPEPVVVSA